MDIHLDTSWCPACAREIMPKRFVLPVAPPPAPAPPPSSPSSSPSKPHSGDADAAAAAPRTTRPKNGTIRARGGLVHGTGRVKPNGAVKRSNSTTVVKGEPTATTPAPSQPAAPLRQRTVIDQGPIPLYCSDECRMSDLNSIYGVLSHDFDPHRESTVVPRDSYTSLASGCEAESISSSGGVSSIDSFSSTSHSSESTRHSRVSSSIATLAALYDFPPLPPPPPIIEQANSQSSCSDSEYDFDQYNSGVMMAARRIKAALCPEPVKRSPFNLTPDISVERQPIPGWTDGSDAWRSSVYSLATPKNDPHCPSNSESNKQPKSIVASPHHSRGVLSTVGEPASTSQHNASTPSLPVTKPTAPQTKRSTSYAGDLYSKYPLSFSRRSESRTSLHTPGSLPTTSSTFARSSSHQRQGRPLLKRGAEGKLLVPDVRMKTFTGSSLSPSAGSSASLASLSSYPASSQRSTRSPLSQRSSETSEGYLSDQYTKSDALPSTTRPSVETRSWSYDNLMTYPVMHPTTRKERRIQKQVVNGEEKDIEVEVEIAQPFKQLFLFSGKEVSL